MKKSLVRAVATLALLAVVLPVRAQQPPSGLPDPYHLLEPKDFLAHRSGSNNPDWASNDDSKRPIPGETTVLADLEGPGVLTHMWVTIADNEYGWPRLLRLRIYYDGSATPSVDAPVGDFFAVGHGFDGARQLRGARAQQLLADALPQVLPRHDHQRGPPPGGEPLLSRRLGEGPVAAGEHALLPRALPAVAPRAV